MHPHSPFTLSPAHSKHPPLRLVAKPTSVRHLQSENSPPGLHFAPKPSGSAVLRRHPRPSAAGAYQLFRPPVAPHRRRLLLLPTRQRRMGTPPAAHWHSSSKKPAAAWAASLAAATAVTLLLLSSRLWGGSGPSRAAEAVLRGGVQVPERPGAGRARAWLATYYAELQHSPGGTGNNCHAIALDCAAPGAPWTAAPPLAGERQPQPQQQQGLQPEQEKRYLVLAAVGDRWSPTANGWVGGWLRVRDAAAAAAAGKLHCRAPTWRALEHLAAKSAPSLCRLQVAGRPRCS